MLDAPKRFLLSALAGKMCTVTKQLYSGNGTCRISDLVVAAVVALFFPWETWSITISLINSECPAESGPTHLLASSPERCSSF